MEKVTAGRDALGTFAPKFAALNDDVLFGEVWAREAELAPRDRSLITVTALIAGGVFDSSLQFHLQKAKENGITKTDIAEVLTHLAFYGGWPQAWAAFRMATEIWTESGASLSEIEKQSLFPIGKPNDAFAAYFIGQSYLHPLVTSGVPIYNVTFEPGCRNNWHIHHATQGGGQTLICTFGKGWYQEEGKAPMPLKSGDCVSIAPGVKHWHGAARGSWFAHLAMEIPGENASTEWCEPVDDGAYPKDAK